jgi:hypothetical protein
VTETETELSRKLAGHAKWKWMAGMCVLPFDDASDYYRLDGIRLTDETEWSGSFYDNGRVARIRVVNSEDDMVRGEAPDLSDPATQGCLIAMLREAYPFGSVEWDDDPEHGLVMMYYPPPRGTEYHSEATIGAALARALLAAWGAE